MCERTVQLEEAMAQPSAHQAVFELLMGRVEVFTAPGQPADCMTIQAVLASGEPHHEIVDVLAAAREDVRRAVLDRFGKAVTDGDLPAGTECEALARYVMAAIYGLSVEAASGAPKEELLAAAVLAAQVVPKH